ncbi:MAG: hypothetical protein ACI4TK_02095 [Agathobacter sp.]
MIDFNNFNENISDEMLAAYIDGNATESEKSLIENSISDDSMLSEAIDIANDANSLDNSFDWDLYEGDYGFWELGLPPVLNEDDVMVAADSINSFSFEDMVNQVVSEQLSGDYHVWGESGENAGDPIFIQQPDDHSCALRSQQIILRDFGIDIPFNDLEKIALDNGVYTNEGTYTYDIGKVLELAGVGMHQVTGTSMDDLMNELSQGHRVIVSVDADELWYNDNLKGRLKNWFNDVTGHQGGNHALIVAGVEVNPNDVNDIKVVLTDPGTGHLRIEYPANQFMNAWKDSDCFMAATDDPAPFQYDASTGMEVPSNFAIKQHINEFVSNNSYQLSPDLVNIPFGYQPSFTGRIDFSKCGDEYVYNSEFDGNSCLPIESNDSDDSYDDSCGVECGYSDTLGFACPQSTDNYVEEHEENITNEEHDGFSSSPSDEFDDSFSDI